MMAMDSFWSVSKRDYQVTLKVIDEPNEPTIDFPLVIEAKKQHSKEEVIAQVGKLAAQPTNEDEQSPLRRLLDSNGGAIHMKGLNLQTADDFSDFLDGLAGKGPQAWVPHEPVGLQVLRRPQARNVLTTNEYLSHCHRINLCLIASGALSLIETLGGHQATLLAGTTNTPSRMRFPPTWSSSARDLRGLAAKPPSSMHSPSTIASRTKFQILSRVAEPKVSFIGYCIR